MRRLREEQAGYALIEVMVAAMLLAGGVFATLSASQRGQRLNLGAQRQQQAVEYAQKEIETISAATWATIGTTTAPVAESDATPGDRQPSTPAAYVSGTNLLVKQDFRDRNSAPPSGVTTAGEPLVYGGSGTVVAKSTGVTIGSSTATVYRFVTWRDEKCVVAGTDLCAVVSGESKRIVVAVVLANNRLSDGVVKPVYVSTTLDNPNVVPVAIPAGVLS